MWDTCDTCYVYDINLEKTEKHEEEQAKHLKNKELTRKIKDEDRKHADSDTSVVVSCFDLQKVIPIPQSDKSSFYYKCKLSLYNFTIFDVNSKDGFCYIWTEQIAKRGGNEVASCLFNFIEIMVEHGKKTFHFYSDNCIGQNKNKIIILMYLYAANKFSINIEHRFFEPGHSQNENDSIHALIERNKQGKELFTPDQFVMLVKLAKVKGKPYKVKEMTQSDFYDFKSLEGKRYKNFQRDSEGKKVNWNSIKEFKVLSDALDILFVKYILNICPKKFPNSTGHFMTI